METCLRWLYFHGFIAAIVGGLWLFASVREPKQVSADDLVPQPEPAPLRQFDDRDLVPIGLVDTADAIEP